VTTRQARRIREGITYGRRFAAALNAKRYSAALAVLVVFMLGGVSRPEADAFMYAADVALQA
jgi:hypothetical protein